MIIASPNGIFVFFCLLVFSISFCLELQNSTLNSSNNSENGEEIKSLFMNLVEIENDIFVNERKIEQISKFRNTFMKNIPPKTSKSQVKTTFKIIF